MPAAAQTDTPAATTLSASPGAAGEWRETRDRHFRFIYRERDRSFADKLLAVADEAWLAVSGLYGYTPREQIPVIIRGDQDSGALGGLTSTFPLRIEIVTCSMDAKVLLQHELTHYVNATRPHGLAWLVGLVFGQDIDFLGMPLQLHTIEGTSSFMDGERGNAWNEMLYRAPVMEGRMWPENGIWTGGNFQPGGLQVYVSQYLFCDWLYRHFGPDVFIRIHKRYSNFPFVTDSVAIQAVTGMEPARIWGEVIRELEERYAEDRRLPGGNLVSMRSSDEQQSWTMIAPTDRGILVRRSSLYHRAELGFWIPPQDDPPANGPRLDKPAQSGEWYPIAGLSGYVLAAASDAAGEILVTALAQSAPDSNLNRSLVSDLWLLEPRAGGRQRSWQGQARQLTRGKSLDSPALSPDGQRLLAIQRMSGDYRLVEVDLRSGATNVVLDLRSEGSGLSVTEASFSPDGRQLVLLLVRNGASDVATVTVPPPGTALSESDLHWVTHDLAQEYSPRFLPDGRLTFASDRENRIWLYMSDGKDGFAGLLRDQIGVWRAWPEGPAYTRPDGSQAEFPEGKRFLYQTYTSDGPAIKRIAAEQVENRELPDFAAMLPEFLRVQAEKETLLRSRAPLARTGIDPEAVPATGDLPFIDFPLPRYWLPSLSYDASGLGIGLGSAGFSLLGMQNWSGEIRYVASGTQAMPKSQLAGNVLWNLALPDFKLQAQLAQDLAARTNGSGKILAWEQNRIAALGMGANLVSTSSPDGPDFLLRASLAGRSTWKVSQTSPFDLAEAWKLPAWWTLVASAGLSATWQSPSATAAIFGGDRLWASLEGYAIPVNTVPDSGKDLALRLGIGGDIAIGTALLGLRGRAVWSQAGQAGYYLDNIGTAGWLIHGGVGRADLLVNFNLPDRLLSGNRLNWWVPMEKTGTSFLVQTGASLSGQSQVAWDQAIQLGISTTLVPFLYYNELPLEAGAAYNLDLSEGATVSLSQAGKLRFWIGVAGQRFSW